VSEEARGAAPVPAAVAGEGRPAAKDLVDAATLYFDQHFKLVPGSAAFEGNCARGVHLLERALAAAREEGSALLEYQAHAMLGIYSSNQQKLARALEHYEEARAVIAAHPEVDWQHRPAMNANNTSGIYRKMGRHAEEIEWLERSRALFEGCGRSQNVLIADFYLGEALRSAGRLDDSLAAYQRALALAVEVDERNEVPWLQWGRGETLAAKGDADGALAALARAEELLSATGQAEWLPRLFATAHRVALAKGDAALARAYEKRLFELPAEARTAAEQASGE
jgi:tetratricopeptide (TPR) repeat protein